jgi:hypothetical protein
MTHHLPRRVLDQISGAENRLAGTQILVGFDGFVDTILHVVDKRESATKYSRVSAMGEYAARIAAAAGRSANFELVTQMVKLGGNGPIMASALASYGAGVTYIGNLGMPNVHPVFADFVKNARVVSLAEPGYTDAIEFDDGKLMCGKLDALREVTWATLTKHLPEDILLEIFSEAALIAMVNWTMLPFMSAIFTQLLTHIAPKLSGEKRWMFFDLADPAKRTSADIAEALSTISKFQQFFKTVLGLNLQESRQIGEVLGLKLSDESPASVTEHAALIREKIEVETVVIHPTSFAVAADAQGAAHVAGPYTATPKITTGAGDHFNAGFCIGRMLGHDLASSLQIGVATSGFYVRNAQSPQMKDLENFLRTL